MYNETNVQGITTTNNMNPYGFTTLLMKENVSVLLESSSHPTFMPFSWPSFSQRKHKSKVCVHDSITQKRK